MVELRLDSVKDLGMPQDCFVSVRIGDTQKLSRLSASRVFRFPKASDRRYGKVEVFRRIGSCNVDVDPSKKELRELNINCSDAGFGTLGLNVAVAGEAKAEPADAVVEVQKEGTKVKAAKEYLAKHGLEVRLSEAMQACLRERPADPAEFLASRLIETRDRAGGVKLPPLKDAPKPEAGVGSGSATKAAAKPRSLEPLQPKAPAQKPPATQAVLPFKDFYKAHFGSMGSDAFNKFYTKFPTKKPAKAAVKAVLPFKPYYAANFGKMGTDTFANFHSKFPTKKPAKAAVKEVLPFKPYYAANFGRMGNDAFSKFHSKFPTKKPAKAEVKAVLPFKPYYAANFGGVGNDAFSKLYNSFPVKKPAPSPKAIEAVKETPKAYLKPSVGTWLSKLPPSRKTVAVANTAAAGFKLQPSVGTWLAARPPALKNLKEAETKAAAGASFKTRPSVGTWLAAPPRRLSRRCLNDSKAKPAVQKTSFTQKPSVGTWLGMRQWVAAAPPAKEQSGGFVKRPSVGTWLASPPKRAA